MPDNTFILKKLPNVSELSLIFITQIIVMNMLATIAITIAKSKNSRPKNKMCH